MRHPLARISIVPRWRKALLRAPRAAFALVLLLGLTGAVACASEVKAPAAGEAVPADVASEEGAGADGDAAPEGAGGGQEAAALTSGSGDEAEAPGPRIGLVTDVGEVDDRSFNQSAWEGAQAAAELLGGEADYIETRAAADYADNIAEFAENGYDVIVTVGFALGQATQLAAAEYPDVLFVGVDQFQPDEAPEDWEGDWPLANVAGLVFQEDRAGFLAGAMAAHLTESGTVAAALGTDLVPPVVAFKEGFEAGALSVDPDIEVLSTYHPGGIDVAFTDPEWGAATAAQAMDQGADVVFGAGGKTGNGAIIEAAGREGVWCIGVDTDQWETVPEAHPCLVTSAVKLIEPGVVEIIDEAAQGLFAPGNRFGRVGLAPFHDHDAAVSDEMRVDLDRIESGLTAGTIETGYAP